MNNISVVIPVYNEAKILHTFLMYLQKINSNNIIEFLVVDGGSSDSSKAIVLEFSKKYTKFKSIDSPKRARRANEHSCRTSKRGHLIFFAC